jgi:small basic protein
MTINNIELNILLQDHLKIIRPYDPYTATVCALYFVFGVVCAFFGYRCFKAIMFLYGFIFGSMVVYLICSEEEVLPGEQIKIQLLY